MLRHLETINRCHNKLTYSYLDMFPPSRLNDLHRREAPCSDVFDLNNRTCLMLVILEMLLTLVSKAVSSRT